MALFSQRRRGSLVSLRLIFSWVLQPTCVVHSAKGFYSVIICETNSNINRHYFGDFWHFLDHSLYGGSPHFVLPFSFNNPSIPKAALSIYAGQFLFNICNSCILKIYLLLLLICICIWVYVQHVCAEFLGGQKKELEFLQLELHVVLSLLMWVLGIKLSHLVPKQSLQPLTLYVEINLLAMEFHQPFPYVLRWG